MDKKIFGNLEQIEENSLLEQKINELVNKSDNRDIFISSMLKEKTILSYVIKSQETGEDIGLAILYGIDYINKNACIDGFVTDRKYTGELVKAFVFLLNKAFIEMEFNKIYSKYIETDIYYKDIYDYLMFVREGILRDHVKLGESYYNLQIKSILCHEFKRSYLSGNNLEKRCMLEGF